jgi:hypothetical protein
VPGARHEDLVGRADDAKAEQDMRDRIAFSDWMSIQISLLRKLGFQVARGFFAAGLTMVGTLAYTAWLNELGAITHSARTLDIDLARRQPLKLAAPTSFLQTLEATQLPFCQVPGLPSATPSTSVKPLGVEGLRVDLLAPGSPFGKIVQIPEWAWFAQTVPYYDYLLEDSQPAAFLAGGHCIPVNLPHPGRMVWHKLYSSIRRTGFPEKAVKDRIQAVTLAAALVEYDASALKQSLEVAPPEIRSAAATLGKTVAAALKAHPEAADVFSVCL